MEKYLPEGRRNNGKLTAAALLSALSAGEILEARAVRCTEAHDLIIEGADFLGIIPRNETSVGIESGKTREIAILSRVGKPVCFCVTGAEDGVFYLSRKMAQEKALRYYMDEVQTGEIIECRVTHLENFGAFVDIGCGVISMIGIENISVSRISHPSERFYVRQDIRAVVTGKDRENGRITLSHKELLGTWEQNAAGLRQGETVGGTVRGVEDYGLFVELTPNLSGLAEKKEGCACGACVSVFIKSIVPEKMKIKLAVIDVLECPVKSFISEKDYFITEGILKKWTYSPASCLTRVTESLF
ncbi:MAG: 30S ribosomal protein S1 [Clostridia bacterium]|nr:30S ribosomal protein S1 [Clostridia bacterium]